MRFCCTILQYRSSALAEGLFYMTAILASCKGPATSVSLSSTSRILSAKLSVYHLYLDDSQNGFRIILHHYAIPTRSVYSVNRGRREKTMRWIDEELLTNEGTTKKVLDSPGMSRDCCRALGTGQQVVLASEEGEMRWTCSSIRNRVLLNHKTRRQS